MKQGEIGAFQVMRRYVQQTTVCWTSDQTIAVRSLMRKAIPLRGYKFAPHGWSGPVWPQSGPFPLPKNCAFYSPYLPKHLLC